MKCYNCGQEVEDGAEYCGNCGTYQGAGATVVLDQAFNPYANAPESGRTETLQQANPVAYTNMDYHSRAPRVQFATNRGLLKMILLGLVTFGIYDMVTWCKIVTELNVAACRYDGKRTMPYFAMIMLAPITLGILPLVWSHKFCDRIGGELIRRGCGDQFNATTFWLWNVLGSLIVVGPFVFVHKLMKAMNAINSNFNING